MGRLVSITRWELTEDDAECAHPDYWIEVDLFVVELLQLLDEANRILIHDSLVVFKKPPMHRRLEHMSVHLPTSVIWTAKGNPFVTVARRNPSISPKLCRMLFVLTWKVDRSPAMVRGIYD